MLLVKRLVRVASFLGHPWETRLAQGLEVYASYLPLPIFHISTLPEEAKCSDDKVQADSSGKDEWLIVTVCMIDSIVSVQQWTTDGGNIWAI